jgi:hypothetical protein
MKQMPIDYQWEQASVKHLYSAQNGEPMRARFRNWVHSEWTDGFLVGWVKGDQPWISVSDFPDSFDYCKDDGETCLPWKYCEVTTKQS